MTNRQRKYIPLGVPPLVSGVGRVCYRHIKSVPDRKCGPTKTKASQLSQKKVYCLSFFTENVYYLFEKGNDYFLKTKTSGW